MEIELFTDDGVMLIHENELLSITDEELDEFQISREDLRRVFTEAAKLMKGHAVPPIVVVYSASIGKVLLPLVIMLIVLHSSDYGSVTDRRHPRALRRAQNMRPMASADR